MAKTFPSPITLLLLLLTLNNAAAAITITNTGSGKVAVVTGASRGIGRGIALELGRAGYTVYALGRSSRYSDPRNLQFDQRAVAQDLDLTVESIAEEISSYNNDGIGYAVPIDLRSPNDMAIREILEEVTEREGGRLDLVVCSAFSVPPGSNLRDDFWKQGMGMWDAVNDLGLRQVYNTCCSAVPFMIDTAEGSNVRPILPQFTTTSRERSTPRFTGANSDSGSGRNSNINININSNTTPLICLISSFGARAYTFNVAYGVGKAAIDRLASDMALQLRPYNIATISLYPGLVRTEGNIQMEIDGTWADASGGLDLSQGETPEFSGRAVVALASLDREKLMERSGGVEVVAELADELDFREDNGRKPSSIRSLKYLVPNFVFKQKNGKKLPGWLVPDILLPWSIFSSPPPPE